MLTYATYVSIRQYTSAYAMYQKDGLLGRKILIQLLDEHYADVCYLRQHTSAYDMYQKDGL